MLNQEQAITEILQAVKSLTGTVAEIQTDVKEVRGNVKTLQTDVKDLQRSFKDLQTNFQDLQTDVKDLREVVVAHSTEVDTRFEKLEAQMVTKDYLDDKIADVRGEFMVMIQRKMHREPRTRRRSISR